MKHEGVICIGIPEKERIIRWLTYEPKDESEMFKEGDAINHAFTFDDGRFIVVELCGVNTFETDGCNIPWTQAVLFDENGSELCCSDVCDEYFGEWELEYDGEIYFVNVI